MNDFMLLSGRKEFLSKNGKVISDDFEKISCQAVRVSDLKKQFEVITEQLNDILTGSIKSDKGLNLKEITVHLEVSSNGKISLAGSSLSNSNSTGKGIILKFSK